MPVSKPLRLAVNPLDQADFDRSVRTNSLDLWAQLKRSGRERGQAVPGLHIPIAFESSLSTAWRFHAQSGNPDACEQLLTHYACWAPQQRLEQLHADDCDYRWAFDTPIDWESCPALCAVIDSFFNALLPLDLHLLGEPQPTAFKRRYRTVGHIYAQTYFGNFMPMLYAYRHDIRSYRKRGDDLAVLDRRFAAPLAHELAHGPVNRKPLEPPILDECIAGWLGCVMCPQTLVPQPDQDCALFAAARFAQIGAAFEQWLGREALIAAQFGRRNWGDILPVGFGAVCERLGWDMWHEEPDLHLLPNAADPMLWIKLIALARYDPDTAVTLSLSDLKGLEYHRIPAPEVTQQDVDLMSLGLQSMCLINRLDDGSYRVELNRAAVRIDVDAHQGMLIGLPEPLLKHQMPLWFIPTSIAAVLRARGIHRKTISLTFDQAPQLAVQLAQGFIPD